MGGFSSLRKLPISVITSHSSLNSAMAWRMASSEVSTPSRSCSGSTTFSFSWAL